MAETVKVPDIGDFTDVPVIEVLVSEGDEVEPETPLVTLESDKATMDVPAPQAGTITKVLVSVGDKLSEGDPVCEIEAGSGSGGGDNEAGAGDEPEPEGEGEQSGPADGGTDSGIDDEESGDDGSGSSESAGDATTDSETSSAPNASASGTDSSDAPASAGSDVPAYAGPAVRRLAREQGVDLSQVSGSGRKGRITKEDVENFKDGGGAGGGAGGSAGGSIEGLNLAPWPTPNFSKHGETERVELSRLKQISGPNLARNWVYIPHVTHNDEADITELEAFRKQINSEQDVKVTMVALMLKACVPVLKAHPEFNSSLDGDGLILKRYYHLAFAADTPDGLLVPVIKDVDKKGLLEIAEELITLSGKAREGKLGPAEMSGATFTISSLGGIGGTSFTPIVNAPEVAILGVTRSAMKPVWDGEQFVPRLMVPLSLSYDHRVVDGAAAARFTADLVEVLTDFKRVLL